jgi:transcription initiation factor IIE alpha subunit
MKRTEPPHSNPHEHRRALTRLEEASRVRAMRADGMDDHHIADETGLDRIEVRRILARIRNIDGAA